MAASGSAAGRPLSSTRTDPRAGLAPSVPVTPMAVTLVPVTLVPVTLVPVLADARPPALRLAGPADWARRSACAATAAAEPRVTAPGTAAAIRSPTSSYSVQPS